MIDRKLKNYEKYLSKIEFYAKAIGIKIEYAEEPSEGAYIPARHKVRIDTDLSESSEIATLLHELGHEMDDTLTVPVYKLERAYEATYKDKPTKAQLKLVLECERKAWYYGKVIAAKLKIKLGKWYDECEKNAIAGYKGINDEKR